MPFDSLEVRTEIIQVDAADRYFVAVTPAGQSVLDNPIRGFEHALLRPYEKVSVLGAPIVGSVQYQFVHLPVLPKPSVLFSTAVRPAKQVTDPRLLPGSLFIFPGIRYQRTHSRSDFSGYIHHLSVRELPGRRIEVYVNSRSTDDPTEPVRKGRAEKVSPEAGFLHIGQIFLRDRLALDDLGVAMERLSDGAVASMKVRGSFSPDPFVENHPLLRIPENPALATRPHLLWSGLFLARAPPSDELIQSALKFFLHDVRIAAVDYDEDYDGPFHAHASVVDFSSFADSAIYRYLVTLTAIIPGGLKSSTGLVAFPKELPFLPA